MVYRSDPPENHPCANYSHGHFPSLACNIIPSMWSGQSGGLRQKHWKNHLFSRCLGKAFWLWRPENTLVEIVLSTFTEQYLNLATQLHFYPFLLHFPIPQVNGPKVLRAAFMGWLAPIHWGQCGMWETGKCYANQCHIESPWCKWNKPS